jgi:hypothetical protein
MVGAMAVIVIAVVSLALVQGLATTEAAAQEQGGAIRGTRGVELATGSEWQLGIEIADDPAGLLRWQAHDGVWTFGAGATAGPGAGDIQLRIAPHVRLQRTLAPRVRVGAGLGLEWTRLAREGNDEESELQWDMGVGWRPAERLLTEAGVRWTDYRNRRASAYLRVAVPLGTRGASDPPESPTPALPPDDAEARAPGSDSGRLLDPASGPSPLPEATEPVHTSLPQLGVPPTPARDGRLDLSVEPVRRSGSGIVLVAANPRGDPDPRSGAEGANVDRLGLGTETWGSTGAWSGWARWRSDLHTDPTIADRTRAATEGLFFPVSISFSGGARWSPHDGRLLGVAARHDPRALLWLPHLGQERTARVGTTHAEASFGRASLDFAGTRLEPIEGRSVDALDHARVRVDVAVGRGLSVGLEHERLDTPGGERRRNRGVLQRSGRLSARLFAGDDIAVRVGTSIGRDAWRVDAWASYRSEPELLHYDRLVASGWGRPGLPEADEPPEAAGSAGATPADGDVWAYGLTAARGPLRMALSGTVGDPVWAPESIEGGGGGTLDLIWTDRVADDRIEGRLALRVAEWGPDRAWWRELPTADGWIETRTPLGPALLSARVAARTELSSVRAGLEHPAGAELGVGLTGPLPDLGSLRGMIVSMRLDDLLDSGLPVRVGAPERGRRLTLSLAWTLRSAVHR